MLEEAAAAAGSGKSGGADEQDQTTKNGQLREAAAEGDVGKVRRLLEEGADVDAADKVCWRWMVEQRRLLRVLCMPRIDGRL